MNLKEYALIAVLVGLIFVGLELRQNTLMQRVTATQALSVDDENAADALGKDTQTGSISK